MATAYEGDELIDIRVRLPRRPLERSLLPEVATSSNAEERRLREAKAILSGRRRRAVAFTGVRFHDPSWDMILELYVGSREDRRLTVTQLCSMGGGSTTTALRHLENLEALGYIAREADEDDRRRANIIMLPRLAGAVDRWLDSQLIAVQVGC